ncbi:MAG: hypothetical protein ABI867_21595 [Kofleriaceae bacterium]
MRLAWILVAIAPACGSVSDNADVDAPVAPPLDAAPDAPGQGRCNPTAAFGAATPLSAVNTSVDDFSLALTTDEKSAFLSRVVQPPGASSTIVSTQRASSSAAFDVPSTAKTDAINNAAGDEFGPSPTSDGLLLYFHRQNTDGISIVVASRADPSEPFASQSQVSVDGTGLQNALSATISADGQTLYWLDFNDFGKVFAATRGLTPSAFTNKRAASTIAIAGAPVLSTDELTLYYAVGNGDDVLVSTRASKTATFGVGVPVGNVNSAALDNPVAVTRDDCELYIASTRSGGTGGFDIWIARRGN